MNWNEASRSASGSPVFASQKETNLVVPLLIRPVREMDLARIQEIQSSSPEASQWPPRDYLSYDCRVAEENGSVLGFAVSRQIAPEESEILNMAVDPSRRRQGIGQHLLGDLLAQHPGQFSLEVRESNEPALRFYEQAGFRAITKRLQYYSNPVEAAIVMKLHS